MPLKKARANLVLEHYCKRLEELFSDVDVCVTALFIDVMHENYGYRTTIYDDKTDKAVRVAEFSFPYRHHIDMDCQLKGVEALFYAPDESKLVGGIELYSKFSSDTPSDELLRSTGYQHAEHAFFYLTDGWNGSKYQLDKVIRLSNYIPRPKKEGIDWLMFRRTQREVQEIFNDNGAPASGVVLP